MRKSIGIVALLLVVFVQGCVPSLHPLYTKDTVVFDDKLIGKWSDGDDEYWEFYKAEAPEGEGGEDDLPHYRVIYSVDGVANVFEGHLVKLGKHHYINFFPGEQDKEIEGLNAFWAIHVVGAHTFARIAVNGSQLSIKPFNPDWISEQIEKGYIRIKHEKLIDGGIVITASSKDLQKFVMKYGDYQSGKEKAFMESETWKKVK